MLVTKRYFFLFCILFCSLQYAYSQCTAKIGLNPGSNQIGCAYPLAINFNSTASTGVQNISWDFGDGETTATNNPIHEFTYDSINRKDKIYKVVLTVTCLNGSIKKDSIDVTAQKVPYVNFSADKSLACQLGDPVCFTNNSENNPTYSYDWKFDQGETSTDFSPCNVFSLSGFKYPSLTVTTDKGCAKPVSMNSPIEIVPVPNPSFLASPQTGCNPLNVGITNNTNPTGISKVWWIWGDGQIDSVFNPVNHIYTTEGVYNLKLKIRNDLGCENTSQLVINNKPTPGARISLSSEVICLNKPVDIVQDTTSYPGAVYTWDFDNPTTFSGSDKGPYAVSWNIPGLKQLTLSINLNGCIGSDTKMVFVNPYSIVHLEYVENSTIVCENDELQFLATPSYYNTYNFLINNDTIQSSSSFSFKTKALDKTDKVTVQALDRFNCPCHTITDPIQVDITPLPNVGITSVPSGSSICSGDTLVISALPLGFETYTFFDGNTVLEGVDASLVFDYNKASGKPIKVLASDKGCESDTSASSSFVLPQVKEKLKTPQVNCGKSTVGSIDFQWDAIPNAIGYEISLNGGAFQPVNGALTHQILIPIDSTVYAHVRAKGALPCGDSEISIDSASCKSIPCSLIHFATSNDLELCEGQSSIISIKDISIPNFDIFWNNSATPTANRLRVIEPTQTQDYYVRVKNADEPLCPSVSKFIHVLVNEIPTVTLTSNETNTVICEDTPLEFRAVSSEFDSYEFYNNWDLVQNSTSPVYKTSNLKDQRKITVKAIKNGCKSLASNAISYTIQQKLSNTQVVCGTTSASSVNFLWDNVPNASGFMVSIDSVNGQPNFIDVGNSNTYKISGLPLGVSRTLTVKPYGTTPCAQGFEYASATCFTEVCVPIDFDKSDDINLCKGDSVNLFVHNISIPNFSVAWNSEPYSNDTLRRVTFVQDTIILVSVRNNSQPQCNSSKKYFNVHVQNNPPITLSTANYTDTLCSGTAVTFIASPAGYDEYWFYDNWKMVQKSASPIFVSEEYRNKHIIHVKPKNNGCLNKTGASIQRAVIEPLEPPQVNCGTTTTNSIEFVWDSIPNAKGYIVSVNDNTFIPSNNSFSHTITTTPATEVTIEVIAQGDGPCGNSLSSTIWSGKLNSCISKPCTPINFTKPNHREICEGQTVVLEIKDITSVNYDVSWREEPVTKDLTYTFLPIISDTSVIAYYDLNQLACPPAKKYTVIKVHDIPYSAIYPYDDSICYGDTASVLSTNPGYDNYSFYSNNTLLYTGPQYYYTFPQIIQDTSVYLKVTNYTCNTTTDTVEMKSISVDNVNLITSSPSGFVCENDALLLTLQGNGFEKFSFWRKDSLLQLSNKNTYSIPRIYLKDSSSIDSVYAYASNYFGCLSNVSNEVRHKILPKTNVTIGADKSTICLLENVTYTTIPSNLVTYSFLNNQHQFRNGSEPSIITNNIGFVNNVQVIATNSDGCKSDTSNSIVLNVKPIAVPQIVASDTSICIGDKVQLDATYLPGFETATFFWSNSNTGKTIEVSPNATSEFTVYSMFEACKSANDTVDIYVDQVKTSIDSVLPITKCIGSVLQLEANGGTFYQWFPSDSVSDDSIQKPTITVHQTQLYTFIAKNTACVDSSKILVIMDLCLEELPLPIPQIITPNEDGINDFWNILHVDYFTENTLEIYNRWGNIVFEAAPYTNTWIGQSTDGENLPNGTYFYQLSLGPNKKTYTGFVMINK